MICKLCGEEKVKLCKAHLVPESFYRYMYPDGKVGGDALKMVRNDLDYAKRTRIGLFDDGILCAQCDLQLGLLDAYGKEALLGTNPRLKYAIEEGQIFTLDQVDAFKLMEFVVSVLWRCSISTLKELNQVHLGLKFEAKIKRILLGNLSELSEFSIVVLRYRFINEDFKKMLFLPIPHKINGLNYYYIYFPNGYKILIKVDSRPQLQKLIPLTLTAGNPVHLLSMEYFEETEEYSKTKSKLGSIKGVF